MLLCIRSRRFRRLGLERAVKLTADRALPARGSVAPRQRFVAPRPTAPGKRAFLWPAFNPRLTAGVVRRRRWLLP